MQIFPGSTYTRSDGSTERIMGLAKHPPIDDQLIYWSLAGNWYSEDGTYVEYRQVGGKPENKESYSYEHTLAKGSWKSLVREVK